MRERTWLLLDSNFLAWRAFHSMPGLTHKEVKTGVLYGFFRDVGALVERFDTPHVVFCFDHRQNLRKEVYPPYKRKRHSKELPEEEKMLMVEMRRQVDLLRDEYLPKVGYRNVLVSPGYESDDIIARVVCNLPRSDGAIVVSADADLYQLLRGDKVMQWNPNKQELMSERTFISKYSVWPKWWWKVKALSGCSSDEVSGVPGVGEKTAIKYLRGELKPTSVVCQRIESEQGKRRFERNKTLVKLPYAGTPNFEIQEDSVDPEAWARVADELGMKSLRDHAPVPSRSIRRRTLWDPSTESK
jgi:DNA polymerase-1